MEYVKLGGTELEVSRIALGCMGFGGSGRGHNPWALDEEAAAPVFRRAVELGITFWDTANVYGGGASEELVGRAVRRYTRREDVVLATKAGLPMHDGPGGSGLSRRAILEQVDGSLAWVLGNPVVTAPIVGATRPGHLDDAVAALDVRLTGAEVTALEAPYTPRLPTGF
jgi:aryl-alcohol dehydrogenase-like predicted oxidoreductase